MDAGVPERLVQQEGSCVMCRSSQRVPLLRAAIVFLALMANALFAVDVAIAWDYGTYEEYGAWRVYTQVQKVTGQREAIAMSSSKEGAMLSVKFIQVGTGSKAFLLYAPSETVKGHDANLAFEIDDEPRFFLPVVQQDGVWQIGDPNWIDAESNVLTKGFSNGRALKTLLSTGKTITQEELFSLEGYVEAWNSARKYCGQGVSDSNEGHGGGFVKLILRIIGGLLVVYGLYSIGIGREFFKRSGQMMYSTPVQMMTLPLFTGLLLLIVPNWVYLLIGILLFPFAIQFGLTIAVLWPAFVGGRIAAELLGNLWVGALAGIVFGVGSMYLIRWVVRPDTAELFPD